MSNFWDFLYEKHKEQNNLADEQIYLNIDKLYVNIEEEKEEKEIHKIVIDLIGDEE